ncbi:RNA-guided pseudouridylation complex pseudouridine synthase subunit Cbf5 [Candidatus Woesearchaeota archaeon]|nr:MAG: RNA-guided pseudouridylation complex pseudouridine synthase subunit Cbf5 [Candidatus Woesearchaeota archaeon]
MMLPFEKIQRNILQKKQTKTNLDYGTRPEERKIEDYIQYGVVNINKPSGPTSHQVSDYVKKILNLKKAGHSGTLDPKVTGVLPIALGKATKVVQTLLTAGKEYVCLMHVHKKVDEQELRKVMNEFVGDIEQLPPIKSAVKRRIRTRSVYYIDIIEIKEQDVLFRVGCQAGTYIRKLVHDIGVKLKTGAHMAQLVRTKAGPFKFEEMVTLQDLRDAYEIWKENNDEKMLRKVILPMEKAVEHLPKIWISDYAVDPVAHGADLSVPGVVKLNDDINQGDMVAIFTLKDELVALGEALMNAQNIYMKEKGVAVKVKKVFYERKVYPKFKLSRQN